ncbi:hypothetical protein EH223_11505 [candidate division KSB1 bacterium]|nr:hypothetical protein [candidate division KSB1 bacterium]RQW02835.1 MAG: hypothetical protein EH223_11505 [candidate division KSB1 bacterium]
MRIIVTILAVLLFFDYSFTQPEAVPDNDPLAGNYILGISAEIFSILSNTQKYWQRIYDDDGSLIQEPMKLIAASSGYRQMDITTGDFNNDGIDDVVYAFERQNRSINLVIPHFKSATLEMEDASYIQMNEETLYNLDNLVSPSCIRLITGNFDQDPID